MKNKTLKSILEDGQKELNFRLKRILNSFNVPDLEGDKIVFELMVFNEQFLHQSIKDALEACRVEEKRVPLEAFQEKDIPGIALFDQITGWNANTTQYDENVIKFMGEK